MCVWHVPWCWATAVTGTVQVNWTMMQQPHSTQDNQPHALPATGNNLGGITAMSRVAAHQQSAVRPTRAHPTGPVWHAMYVLHTLATRMRVPPQSINERLAPSNGQTNAPPTLASGKNVCLCAPTPNRPPKASAQQALGNGGRSQAKKHLCPCAVTHGRDKACMHTCRSTQKK